MGTTRPQSPACDSGAFELEYWDLNVSLAGTGAGSVDAAGVDCQPDCDASLPEGSQLTLTATPAAGSTFAGWSGGGCSGTGTCVIDFDADKSVTATFTANPVSPPPQTQPQSPAKKKKCKKEEEALRRRGEEEEVQEEAEVSPRRAQSCGFARRLWSSASSRTDSSTPASRATSRSGRPESAASLTISAALS